MLESFYDINKIIYGITITLFIIGCAGFLYTFMGAIAYKVDKKISIKCGIYLVIDLIILYIIQVGFNVDNYSLEQQNFVKLVLEKIPSIVIIVMSVLNLVLSIALLYDLKRWVTSNVSFISLKEGIDALPMGICFYTVDGLTLLVNSKIEELCFEITEHSLLNGIDFWEELVNNNAFKYIENKLMIRLKDGSFWCFEKQGVKENLYQIVCIDVTEEYKLKHELENENERLNSINKRLLDMKIKVAQIARQEEQLAAKANIHSDMGHVLLSSKALIIGKNIRTEKSDNIGVNEKSEKTDRIEQDFKASIDDIVCNWKYVIKLLRCGDRTERSNNTIKELYKAAHFLGLELDIEGNIPNTRELLTLFIACIRECMTNTVRHSKAKKLHIIIEETHNQIQWKYINEPQDKVEEVVEGGGLLALRKMITEFDGDMIIEINKKLDTKEVFQLTVILPTRKDEI